MDMALPERIWRYSERALLLTGLALLASYTAGVIDSELGRHHGLTAFADARAAAIVAPSRFSAINNRALIQPDQSLWSAIFVPDHGLNRPGVSGLLFCQ